MTNNFKSHSLRGSIKRLFANKATINAHKLYPDAYFARVYLSKTNFKMVEFIAQCFKTSKIRMTNELIERGVRNFYGEAIGKHIQNEVNARETGQHVQTEQIIRELRKLARQKGMNISKFV
jgi:hypothetical protein